MLFDSSLRKELARGFGATVVVLVTIVMTVVLIRTLGEAAQGQVAPQDVLLLLGYLMLGYLPTILTLSLFVAVVGVLSRAYQSSEMVIWLSSGVGLLRFLGPVVRFAWPVWVVIMLLAVLVWPWSQLQLRDLRDRFERRSDIARIAPGQFQESSNGQRVFFIERNVDEAGLGRIGRNVFVAATENGRETITAARSGRLVNEGGERVLVLENGERLETDLRTGERRVTQFRVYRVTVGEVSPEATESLQPKTLSTLALLREPKPANLAELSYRLGLILGALSLTLAAVGLASANPRAGRSLGYLLAVLVFLVYFNLITLTQAWIASGRTTLADSMLVLHGGVLMLALAWLVRRHLGPAFSVRGLRDAASRLRPAAA